ncbi:MAG: ABC transporter permease [Anaerolineales bacterium]|nr:ABC transporter permease [Anaerolineales bacterium]
MTANETSMIGGRRELTKAEKFYAASQWQLIRWKFFRHKLAMVGLGALILLYFGAIFAPFLAPYEKLYTSDLEFSPPQGFHLFHEGKLVGPFVYGIKSAVDLTTYERSFTEDTSQIYKIVFFARGWEYKLFGFIPSDVHLFQVEEGGYLFLFGTDDLGHDLFSRVLQASTISLSIGLVGVFLSFILGCILGGLSGYYGGTLDTIIQRVIEFLISLPTLPVWMALSAAVPQTWDQIQVYIIITVILSLQGWCGLARVVRGKLLELREEDYVIAAQVAGTSDWNIITQHLLPGFASYLIVSITLSIPGMILGETALSFIGLGLRPPTVSWGVLLQQAQNVRTITVHPWLLLPALVVIITVLAFNFVGDGLRDAADPYVI